MGLWSPFNFPLRTWSLHCQPVPLTENEQPRYSFHRLSPIASISVGLKWLSRPSSKEANKAFGFDICGAGFPPSALLSTTAEQIYQRIQSHVKQGETAKRMGKPAVILGAADALVGMAIGIVTGESIGAIIAKGAQRSGCQYRCELWRNQTLQ